MTMGYIEKDNSVFNCYATTGKGTIKINAFDSQERAESFIRSKVDFYYLKDKKADADYMSFVANGNTL